MLDRTGIADQVAEVRALGTKPITVHDVGELIKALKGLDPTTNLQLGDDFPTLVVRGDVITFEHWTEDAQVLGHLCRPC